MKLPKKIVNGYALILIGSLLYSFFLYLTSGSTVNLALLKIFFNILIVPLLLLFLFFMYAKKTMLSLSVTLLSILSIGCIILLADYAAWGMATGLFFTPDAETVAIIYSEFFIFAIVIGIGMVFYSLYRFFKQRFSKKRRG